MTEPKGPAAKKVGHGEAIGKLLGLWLHDFCLVAGHLALPGVPRNALLCLLTTPRGDGGTLLRPRRAQPLLSLPRSNPPH